MAENDIYGNENKYNSFKKNYENFAKKPAELGRQAGKRKRKYWAKNPDNIKYFLKLFNHFETKDMSFVRRNRLINVFKIVLHVANKDLKNLEREDINQVIIFQHSVNKAPKSKYDFIIDIKYIWKVLFPELDERGRQDENLMPYVVRHLNPKQDVSTEKRRMDIINVDEYEKLLNAFNQDPRMQAFISLAWESLGRPQEILFTKIKDVELNDNYGKIYISEHGKEGVGFLEVIDSFPYVAKWFNQHPLKNNPDAFLFINLGNQGRYKQMRPENINKHLREKIKAVKIKKHITAYSLKRSGVTFRRLIGESDMDIQHAARWRSSRQLKTYDFSTHDDSMTIKLIKRGLVEPDSKHKHLKPTSKTCSFCNTINGITDEICDNCKRPLDRERINKEQEIKEKEFAELKAQMDLLNKKMELIDRWENVKEKTKKR